MNSYDRSYLLQENIFSLEYIFIYVDLYIINVCINVNDQK